MAQKNLEYFCDKTKKKASLSGSLFYTNSPSFDIENDKPLYFGKVFYYDFTNTLLINHDKEDVPYQQKVKLLEQRKLSTEMFLEEQNLISKNLLDALRICLMKDLEVYFSEREEEGIINPRNEMQVLATLKKDIQERLQILLNNKTIANDETGEKLFESQIKLAEKFLKEIGSVCQSFCDPANVIPKQIPFSTEEIALNKFYEWIKQGGIEYEQVAVADFEGFGRGMKTEKDIKEGDIAVAVPKKMILNIDTAFADEKLGPIFKEIEGLDEDTILLLFVIHERFHNTQSFWKPYFDVLPDVFPTALNYGVFGFMELEGTPLCDELFQARDHLRGYQEMLFPKLSDYYPTVFPESVFTYDNFLWARSLFDSRSIKLKINDKILPCLIPMADMLNHHPHAQVSRGNFSEEKQAFVAYTLCNVPSGAQLFLHYGALPNWQLLLYYGFVMRNNLYDNFHIGFEYSYAEDEELTTQKEALMKKLDLSLEHFLSLNKLSSKVLTSLYICLANREEIEKLDKEITLNLEKGLVYLQTCAQSENVISTLVKTIRSLLDAFPKTAKEDLAQLMTSPGRVDAEFSKNTEELIKLTEGILANYKEEYEEEEDNEATEQGEKEDNGDNKEDNKEAEGETEGEGEGEREGEGEKNEDSENEEMQEGGEELSEDMVNILEYRLGQMLILMNSIKFAHFSVEKKRKHSEI